MAIFVQGTVAVVISLFLNYEQILNYVTCNDYIFFGLAAIALIVFRNRDARSSQARRSRSFACRAIRLRRSSSSPPRGTSSANTIFNSPRDTLIGVGILLSGLPVYWLFATARRILRQQRPRRPSQRAVDAIADRRFLGIDLGDERASVVSASPARRPDKRPRSCRRQE